MNQSAFEVQETVLNPMLIAGVRMTGKYSDCGNGFSQIGRQLGRHICGNAFLLHYDDEYKADNADFEACMPIRKGTSSETITVRELAGGRCVSLLHRGPYDSLAGSYEMILEYIRQQGYAISSPTREVYLKGPGMIFKGNPRHYRTEIQMLITEDQA